MAECHHPNFTIITATSGRDYGICDECQWLCEGHIAEANNARFN